MIDFIGISLFAFVFIGVPFHYTVSLLREPTKLEGTSIKFNNERNKCESFIERRLYDALLINGYDLKNQVPCGRYRIDIAIPQDGLAIECDGKEFHSTKKQKTHDSRKNAYLRKNGWKVLRFSGRKINRNLSGVLKRIKKEVGKNLEY